ncbi:MAG: ABC transporter permease [Candidatus Latescibacterota bacterium]
MLRNYLVTGWRGVLRHKLYAAVNTVGLALGIACCALLLLFVEDELSFDRYHDNALRIHRVALRSDWGRPGEGLKANATTPASLAPALAAAVPGVARATRLDGPMASGEQGVELAYGDRRFLEKRIYRVEPTFFDVFSVPFVAGDPRTALNDRYSIVLTRSLAARYFGEADPLGQVMHMPTGGDYRVTGVVEDAPRRSHLRFDALTPWWQNRVGPDGEHQNLVYTYLLLEEGATPEQVEGRLAAFLPGYAGYASWAAHYKSLDWRFFLQPLTRIHLHSHLDEELEPNAQMRTLYLFAALALVVLLMACANYTNLATAQAATRVDEVGVRKVLGAHPRALLCQFAGEAVVVALFALALGVVLIEMALPPCNAFLQRELTLKLWPHGPLLLGLAVGTGLLAGAYPAVYAAACAPATALRRAGASRRGRAPLRRVLVVAQFAVSVGLVCVAGVMYLQVRYATTRELGFAGEQVLVLPVKHPRPRHWLAPENAFRQALEGVPGVLGVTSSDPVPGGRMHTREFRPEGRPDPVRWQSLCVDFDFLEVMQIPLVAGRGFSRDHATDPAEAVILNESAVRALGWDDPLDRHLQTQVIYTPPGLTRRQSDPLEEVRVIGVVQDFHVQSLYHPIEPLVLRMHLDQEPTADVPIRVNTLANVLLKVRPDGLPETLTAVRQVWDEHTGGMSFDYSFLDEGFAAAYHSARRDVQLFATAALLAALVGCIGLFGLASFAAEQRTREIGIRKALGASVADVVVLLAAEVTWLVVIASALACPVAYWALGRWLQNFAYRIALGPELFVAAGVAGLAIAWLAVGGRALRAAMADPVAALRSE